MNLQKGDVLWLISNSGTNGVVVELAKKCHENDIYLERSIFNGFRRKYKLNELTNELINEPIISKIAYLKKSKVILSGGLKYSKIINEWFSSKVVYSLDI